MGTKTYGREKYHSTNDYCINVKICYLHFFLENLHIFYVKFSTYLFFGVVKQQYRIDWTQIILLQNNSILSKVSKFFTIDGGLIKVTNFCSWEVLNLTSALAHKLEFLNMHRTIVLRNIFNRFLQSSRKGYNIRFWKKGLEKKYLKQHLHLILQKER